VVLTIALMNIHTHKGTV